MEGSGHLRLTRQNLPDLYPAGAEFKPGKLMEIYRPRSGKAEAVCIASGATVAEAYRAAEELDAKGIAMSVWNAHSLKPFDAHTTIQIAKEAKLVVTVEDHSIIGGLGTCVAEALAGDGGVYRPLVKLGIQDVFGESGDPAELYEKFGISAKAITQWVGSALNRFAR